MRRGKCRGARALGGLRLSAVASAVTSALEHCSRLFDGHLELLAERLFGRPLLAEIRTVAKGRDAARTRPCILFTGARTQKPAASDTR